MNSLCLMVGQVPTAYRTLYCRHMDKKCGIVYHSRGNNTVGSCTQLIGSPTCAGNAKPLDILMQFINLDTHPVSLIITKRQILERTVFSRNWGCLGFSGWYRLEVTLRRMYGLLSLESPERLKQSVRQDLSPSTELNWFNLELSKKRTELRLWCWDAGQPLQHGDVSPVSL